MRKGIPMEKKNDLKEEKKKRNICILILSLTYVIITGIFMFHAPRISNVTSYFYFMLFAFAIYVGLLVFMKILIGKFSVKFKEKEEREGKEEKIC